jgi:hypothetical protein
MISHWESGNSKVPSQTLPEPCISLIRQRQQSLSERISGGQAEESSTQDCLNPCVYCVRLKAPDLPWDRPASHSSYRLTMLPTNPACAANPRRCYRMPPARPKRSSET